MAAKRGHSGVSWKINSAARRIMSAIWEDGGGPFVINTMEWLDSAWRRGDCHKACCLVKDIRELTRTAEEVRPRAEKGGRTGHRGTTRCSSWYEEEKRKFSVHFILLCQLSTTHIMQSLLFVVRFVINPLSARRFCHLTFIEDKTKTCNNACVLVHFLIILQCRHHLVDNLYP